MHTEACRKRLGECFQSDEILQERAARAEDRMNQWRADRQDKVGRNAPVGDDVVGSGVVNSGVLEAPEEDMQVDEDPMVQGGDETPVINPWRGDEGDATPVLSPLPEDESTVYSPMGDDELEGNVDQGVGAVDDDFAVFGLDWAQIHDSVVQRLREISAVFQSAGPRVAEVYSPPRVTELAERFGMRKGFALDLTTGWDFTIARHRANALK